MHIGSPKFYRTLGWAAAVLILCLGILEAWRYTLKPEGRSSPAVIEQELQKAVDLFQEEQEQLLERSRMLAGTLSASQNPQFLYSMLEEYREMWGIALTRDDSVVIWEGFTPELGEEEPEAGPYLRIRQNNNVLYWINQIPLTIRDSTQSRQFTLYTTRRIQQTNPLAFGTESDYNVLAGIESPPDIQLGLSIFNPVPPEAIATAGLHTPAGDSVGAVYAGLPDDPQVSSAQWENHSQFWRTLFLFLAYLVFGTIFFVASQQSREWIALLVQLFIIGSGWFVIRHFGVMDRVIELFPLENYSADWIFTIHQMALFFIDSLAILLTAFTAYRLLWYRSLSFTSNSFLSAIFTSALTGFLSAVITVSVINKSYVFLSSSRYSLVDLRIFPEWHTIFLYISLGLLLCGLIMLLLTIIRFLFISSYEQLRLSVTVLSLSFIICLGLGQLYEPELVQMRWVLLLALGFFTTLTGIILLSFNYHIFYSFSPVIRLVIGTMLVTCMAGPILYQAQIQYLNDRLEESALEFDRGDDRDIYNLTRNLLSDLGSAFGDLEVDSLQPYRSQVESRFNTRITSFIGQQEETYSYDLRLISADSVQLASYSTDLNSPPWDDFLSLYELERVVRTRGITRDNLEPEVQQSSRARGPQYRDFYRGWIPVFLPSGDRPAAWVLASVYQEQPDFNKPLRAVLASLSYRDWRNSYSLSEYVDRKLVRNIIRGINRHYPVYNRLPESIPEEMGADTMLYSDYHTETNSYKNLYWLRDRNPERIIQSSTFLPDFDHMLFNIFRFNFTLLLIGIMLIVVWDLITTGRLQFLQKSRQFRYRLLDRFLLATLLFLGALIITTHYGIRDQNQDVVRQELHDKIETLSQSLEAQMNRQNISPGTGESMLDSLASPMSVDATFYYGPEMVMSTTSQIYRQHLLPRKMPYLTYHDLYELQVLETFQEVQLSSQNLLIGYRSVMSPAGEPIAAIAIPTFLHSPKLEQQLLETTSDLIIIYLIVFGIFVIGTLLVSRQLTQPLIAVQEGLSRLSEGNLDVTIPVTSNDEIGNLAAAYNQMVYRLKKVQSELAVAEREAAWKEMAQQVAHEIKNPLTPMKLSVQHLERQLSDENVDPSELRSKIRRITDNIVKQIDALNNIASDFSKFSQPARQQFSELNLNSTLRSVSEIYNQDDHVEIRLELTPFPLVVMGMEDELRRVVINLVKNAFEAMPEGGLITIRSSQKKGSAFVHVEDNGTGIPEEDKGRIFVPNFSTKSSGTGLGLAISKKIIESHNGSISFASIEGQGTTFIIKIPLRS